MNESSIGVVSAVQDNIVIVSGLANISVGELVNFISPESEAIQGYAMNLEFEIIKVVLIKGNQKQLTPGDLAFRAYRMPTTRSGFGVLGQINTPLGVLINKSDFTENDLVNIRIYATEIIPIFQKSPGIRARDPVGRPFLIGVTSIDCFLPIGCGQRELIIGDNNTGKSSLGVTALLNQRFINNTYFSRWREFERKSTFIRTNVFSDFVPCIYVFIGKRRSEGVRLKNVFERYSAFNYVTFVFSSSDDLASIQYLAPYSGTAIGEWFRDKGYHAAVIYDDLSEHAVAYRQISLLLRRPPGREAYPGDIFFIHSRLLERSSQMSKELSGGSLTSLPIIETKGGDISGYIPTNVISITDGQIFLSTKLFNEGFRPAVDLGLSVSRVGSKAQYDCMKDVCKKIKSDYSMYKAYASLAKVSSDIDPMLMRFISRGVRLNSFFVQGLYQTVRLANQVMALYSFGKGYIDHIKPELVVPFFNIFFSGIFFESYTKSLNEKSDSLDLVAGYFYGKNLAAFEATIIIHSFKPYEAVFELLMTAFKTFFISQVQPKLEKNENLFLGL